MSFKREQYQLLEKVVLGRAQFTPPFKASSPLDNEARFMHVVNGSSRLYSPNDQKDLKTGDSILMKCENFVNNWFENKDGGSNEAIIIHFYPEVLKFVYNDKLPNIFSLKNPTPANPVEKIPPNEVMTNYVQGLRYYLNNPTFITNELLKVKIQELILVLINSDKSGQIKAILSELFHTREYEFKEIIHSHLFEDLKVEDLAFFAGLSLSSFKRKFKSIFNTSPTRYIKTKRLEKAHELLEKTDLRVSEIAFDCGFNDLGYFSKSFLAMYNYSPSDYRKSLAN